MTNSTQALLEAAKKALSEWNSPGLRTHLTERMHDLAEAIAQSEAEKPAAVAEVRCWEEWLGGDRPRQMYELKKFDGFNALPTGTHQLYTSAQHREPEAVEAAVLTDDWVKKVITKAVQDGRVSWLGYEKDEAGRYTLPLIAPYHYQLARAVVAAMAAAPLPEQTTSAERGL